MAKRFDAIVVGVGAMGSATCAQLARRGVKVLGLEQFDIPHALGSSHGLTRMIRMAYFEHPDYVPLLKRTYELWREIEKSSGQSLMTITGGIFLGPPDGELVPGCQRAAREHGLAHERLDATAMAMRFPMIRVPKEYAGFWEPTAGFVRPEAAVAAMANEALRAGAELHGREAVLEWDADESGVRVMTTSGERYEGGRLVFAAGAWSDRLVRDLGVELVVTRQVMAWVWPSTPEVFALGRFPVWAIEAADRNPHYGFPMLPDSPGLKIARHARAMVVANPDTVERSELPGDEAEWRPALRRHLPEGDGALLASRVCLYTNSPDSNFIIDRHPTKPNVVLACGFSGHGFKFAPVVGEILADMAMRGRTELPAGFLGLGRFRGGTGGARRDR